MERCEGISLAQLQSILLDNLQVIHELCEEIGCRYCLNYGTLLGAIRHADLIPWDDDVDIMMPRKDYIKFLAVAQEKFGDDFFVQTPETDHHYSLLHVPLKIRDNHSTLIEEKNKKYHQGTFIDIFPYDYVGDDEKAFYALKKKCAFLSSLKMKISWQGLSGIKRYIRIALQLVFKLIPARTVYAYLEKQVEQVIDHDQAKNRKLMAGLELVTNEQCDEADIFPLQLHKVGKYEFYVPYQASKILEDQYGDYMTLPSAEEIAHATHGLFYGDKPYETYQGKPLHYLD